MTERGGEGKRGVVVVMVVVFAGSPCFPGFPPLGKPWGAILVVV